jgi:orotidine-5'-phosphate decarboxylase
MIELKTMVSQSKDRIFVSIDVDTLDEAKRLMDRCVGLVGNVKFGLQLATHESWQAGIEAAHERGFKVFCDAKFKDIPNTVERAASALTHYRPEYFTIMADNSLEAMQAAHRGVEEAGNAAEYVDKPIVIGVTVLTSIEPEECQTIYGDGVQAKTLQFSLRALDAGLEAIVCSPEEVSLLRADARFKAALLITPGIRPKWAAANDQTRFTTPAEAIRRGADMLVIGRPITQPPAAIGSVKRAIERILTEIEEATA